MTSQTCDFSAQVLRKHKFLWRSVEAPVCTEKYSKLEKEHSIFCTLLIKGLMCTIDLTGTQPFDTGKFFGGKLSVLKSAHSFPLGPQCALRNR